MTSGDVWVLVPGVHGRWVMDLPPGSFAWEYDRFTFVNQNTGVVMDWPTRILLVYNAQGELVVERVEVDYCNIHGQ